MGVFRTLVFCKKAPSKMFDRIPNTLLTQIRKRNHKQARFGNFVKDYLWQKFFHPVYK